MIMKRIFGLVMMLGLIVGIIGCGKDGPTRFVEYYENGQVEVEGNRKNGKEMESGFGMTRMDR